MIDQSLASVQSEEGNTGPALLAYHIDEAGIEQVHALLDGGRVIVTGCGEGCHIKGDLPTPTGASRRQLQPLQQKSAKLAELRFRLLAIYAA